MRRYYLSPLSPHLLEGDTLFIEGANYHHIVEVCCQHEGAKFELFGKGSPIYLVELRTLEKSRKRALVQVKGLRQATKKPHPHLHLALCLPQFKKMDFLLQKSVELGVHSLHLLFSDYSFFKKELPQGKRERWERIITSACEQSGRADPLELKGPQKLEDFLKSFSLKDSCQALFAYEGATHAKNVHIKNVHTKNAHIKNATEPTPPEGEDENNNEEKKNPSLKTFLQRIQKRHPSLESFWLFVGSEGGFSQREARLFQDKGMEPVSLGEQVLRTETACLVLLSVLKYEFELWV